MQIMLVMENTSTKPENAFPAENAVSAVVQVRLKICFNKAT